MKSRNVLEGIGAALLLLIPYFVKFLFISNIEIYHLHLPITHLVGGLLVDLLVYSILAMSFLFGIQHLSQPIERVLEALFAGLMLWVMVDVVNSMLIHQQYRIEFWGRIWWHSAIAVILLSGVLAWLLPRFSRPAVGAARLVLAAFAFSALWIVPQLLHLAMIRQPDDRTGSAPLLPPSPGKSNQRIIWILFDELSYDQTFEHPAAGMQLPNFDQFRSTSFSFSNLRPVGYYTDRIIPSLFLGQNIDQIRSTIHGDLRYRSEAHGPWRAFDPNATLFALAKHNGWNAGIEGWFNPYCRILESEVNVCSWESNLELVEEYGASEEKSVLANAAIMPSRFGALFTRTITSREGQTQIYHNIMAHSRSLINDNQLQFIYLHIPVPHGPSIYDRHHHMLRAGGTYLDSLVMADDTLNILMREIEATPSAGQTTVIVTSDHSWRIALSRNTEEWTEEEELASGGKFDDRPVLLVHFPGQTSGNNIQAASSEMLEHDMIAGMLRGQIEKPDDLAAFLAQYGH